MENCYLTVTDPDVSRHLPELEPRHFEPWLLGLAGRGLCSALVMVFLKLERMADTPLEVSQRVAALYRLLPTIRDLADDLPQQPPIPVPRRRSSWGSELSLEQRLICLTVKNLKATLEGLDAVGGTHIPGREAARLWTVQSLFEWLGRQIELCARWGRPWPRQTWQEVHDLYAYWLDRLGSSSSARERVAIGDEDYDAVPVYKRLLLVGLIATSGAGALLGPAWAGRLDDWARESILLERGGESFARGSYLVELSLDSPPREQMSAADSVRRALILRPPKQLFSLLAEAAAGRPLYIPT